MLPNKPMELAGAFVPKEVVDLCALSPQRYDWLPTHLVMSRPQLIGRAVRRHAGLGIALHLGEADARMARPL